MFTLFQLEINTAHTHTHQWKHHITEVDVVQSGVKENKVL